MSKSVSESRNAATMGTMKRTRMAARPGARSITAARASCGRPRALRDSFGGRRAHRCSPAARRSGARARIQRRFSSMRSTSASSVARAPGTGSRPADRRLHVLRDLLGDLLPFGHARHRLDSRELDSEGLRLDVPGEGRVVPGLAPRGQVSRQRIEPGLDGGRGEVLGEGPGRVLLRRRLEDGEGRSAGERRPGPRDAVGRGQRRRHPEPLLLGLQATAELSQVPGPREPHREVGAGELLVRVAELRVAHDGREAVPEEARRTTRRRRGRPGRRRRRACRRRRAGSSRSGRRRS